MLDKLPKKDKNMKSSNQYGFTHVAIIAVVVVLAGIGGVGYYVLNKNDSKSTQNSSSSTTPDSSASKETADEKAAKAAAREHFALVYQKQFEEAYQASCQELRDLSSYPEFQSFLSNPGFQAIDLSAIEYTSVDVRNNQAKISGPVGPLDPDSTLEVSLLKKSDQWCIYGYKFK